MGRVITNATILSNFILVKRWDILQKVIVNLCTTFEVVEEINFGVERGVLPATELSRIEVLKLNLEEREVFRRLNERLGRGESSCIAVAMTRGFKMLTDDLDARKYAQKFGIPVSGTIGVLVLALDKEVITKKYGNYLLSEMIKMGFYSPVESLDDVL